MMSVAPEVEADSQQGTGSMEVDADSQQGAGSMQDEAPMWLIT